MLTTACINPKIMEALAHCGHGSKILIADGNYPLQEKTGSAKKVFLGVMPGLPTVPEVLRALLSVVNFERAEVMVPEGGSAPEIFTEFTEALGGMPLDPLGRQPFYDACMEPGSIALAISTGETRVYANLLLSVGCA